MEKQPSLKHPLPPQPPAPQQPPSPHDWEALIDDFQSGVPSRQSRWLPPNSTPLALLDLAVAALLRRDFPSKSLVLLFLEESAHLLVRSPPDDAAPALSSLVDALRAVLQSPADAAAAPAAYALKEQMMVAVTSVAITIDALDHASRQLEALVELLLAVVNRPNHGPDRQTRAVACECLRELEKAYPCLLSEIAGHIWNLCQSERTHAAQSYILLLTAVVHNIVQHSVPPTAMGILSTSVQLVPFNVPVFFSSVARKDQDQDLSDVNLRDIRRVMAFLLERPQILTPLATAEMVFMLTRVVKALEGQLSAAAALLKVQFSGLIYSYDPMLCHVVLMLYSHFSDAFSGDEQNITRRLTLVSKEAQQPLVFRLLALHWLLGVASRPPDKRNLLIPMAPSFYPSVFDPLGLKAAKLDVLALIAVMLEFSGGEKGKKDKEVDRGADSVAKLFEDCLVCVSAFRWLPPWSTETLVAFRTVHKFLTGAVPHATSGDSLMNVLMESTTFRALQSILVSLAVEHPGLVPVIAAFVDRLRGCQTHRPLGECLLQTFDECLLPKLVMDHRVSTYFPIFERIAENDKIPPRHLLELLLKFMLSLVEKHGPDAGLRSWSQGSKVLRICRSVLMNHHSSRIVNVLSDLLSFTSQFFPDLEVRDNARIYLRMLVCIPGKKLRHLLNLGEQLLGVTPSQHSGIFYQVPSPRSSPKKPLSVSSYIHLDRINPLLVKQSWSLTIPYLGVKDYEPVHPVGSSNAASVSGSGDSSSEADENFQRLGSTQEPLRVMDSKVSEILHLLRRHFSCIPDFRHMKGIKIRIACNLRFDAGIFSQVWGTDDPSASSDETYGLPALYAIVLSFSSTAKYGPIPSFRVPFLLGEPSVKDHDIVPVERASLEQSSFRPLVTVELEPREPMPGLVDVTVEANAENGQIISGSLQSIPVGIEDMFLKVSVPDDVSEDVIPQYYLDLFNALWEACGTTSNTGRETFPLKGGKGVAAINGTESVKLLDVSVDSVIGAVECHLSPFVVSVAGGSLLDALKNNAIINNAIWKEESTMPTNRNADVLLPFSGSTTLQIQYFNDEDADSLSDVRRTNLGSFLVLIFLPPRFHLLFQMEVHDTSTLVRIRTDHWPCLAYVDEYLESLFLS